MNMEFKRKLPIPAEIKEMYPISEEGMKAKKLNDQKLYDIFTGQSDKFRLIGKMRSLTMLLALLKFKKRLKKN